MVNRRTFLAVLSALPFMKWLGRGAPEESLVAPIPVLPDEGQAIGRLTLDHLVSWNYRIARADRRIEAYSIVVWDREIEGIPRIRGARHGDDVKWLGLHGRAGVTNCAVNQHHYTLIQTSGAVRIRAIGWHPERQA